MDGSSSTSLPARRQSVTAGITLERSLRCLLVNLRCSIQSTYLLSSLQIPLLQALPLTFGPLLPLGRIFVSPVSGTQASLLSISEVSAWPPLAEPMVGGAEPKLMMRPPQGGGTAELTYRQAGGVVLVAASWTLRKPIPCSRAYQGRIRWASWPGSSLLCCPLAPPWPPSSLASQMRAPPLAPCSSLAVH